MTDRQLVDSVLAGHTRCYAELVSRYSAMVLAKSMGGCAVRTWQPR